MKNVWTLSVLILISLIAVSYTTGITSSINNDFGLFGILGTFMILGIVVFGTVYFIFDSISISKREITGKVIDGDEEENIILMPIIIGNSNMFLPNFSTSYYLSIKTSDGEIYECECDEDEYERIHPGDAVTFIEDVRKSGAVYYYTK